MKHQHIYVLVALAFALSGCARREVGVTDEEIKIGTWGPLTGPATRLAVITRAMEAYFEHVNEEGGVHGRRLNLIVKDDRYDPSLTRGVVEELIEQDQVFAMVGGQGTANGMTVQEYLFDEMVPWINPGSGARVWTIPLSAYVFTVTPTYVTEGEALARYAVEELNADRIGLFYQDDSYGREGQEGVRVWLRSAKKKPAVEVAYVVGETDFSSHAKEIYDAVVDTVIMFAIPSHAAGLIDEIEKINAQQRLRSKEMHANLLGPGILSDPIMFHLLGEHWEGAVVSSGVPDPNSNEPGVQRAREIFQKYAPTASFGSFALMGMVRAELLVEGLRRAGPELTRLGLVLALEGMENWSDNILGRPITFSGESHLGFDSVRLMKAEGGEYVSVTGWLSSMAPGE